MFGIDLTVLLVGLGVGAVLALANWCITTSNRHPKKKNTWLDAPLRPPLSQENKLLEDLEFELAIAEDLHFTDVGDLRERIEKARKG